MFGQRAVNGMELQAGQLDGFADRGDLRPTYGSGIEICNSPVVILLVRTISLLCLCPQPWRKAEGCWV